MSLAQGKGQLEADEQTALLKIVQALQGWPLIPAQALSANCKRLCQQVNVLIVFTVNKPLLNKAYELGNISS